MKAIFPYFESGLPLRSRDLNAIYRRADEEVRHTRTCLHGMGIFYGLKVTPKENKLPPGTTEQVIEVSAGAGVTSQGFLYCAHETVVLRLSKTITIQRDHFGTKGFPDFLDTPIKDLVPATIVAEQLGAKAEELGSSTAILDQKLWVNKLLVIFFEINKETLNGCATCEKGTKAELATKFLLVTKEEWAKLTFVCTDAGTNTATPFDPVLLSLPRFGLNENCVSFSQVASETALTAAYAVTTKATIQTALKGLIDHYSRLFNDDTTASNTAVDALMQLAANAQYHHDYWRLIVRAYNEFVSTSFAQSFAGLPPETCFPKHLIIGEFDGKGVLVNPSSLRTKLYRPPFDDATDADFATAQSLYYRLIAIIKHHRLGNLPNEGIRITPSRRPSYPLSNQAIPYYLKADENILRTNWRPNNPFKTAILSYDNTNRLQNQPYFDEADFYRIEGHIGKGVVEVRDALLGNNDNIQGLRKCLNLPFEIVFVSLQDLQLTEIMTLSAFALQNNGLEHQGGVPSGGTFVLVLDIKDGQREAIVVADFCLPYWWQKPFVKVIADFTVKQDGNIFTFDATPSKNTQTLNWSVNGLQPKTANYATDKLYQPKLDSATNDFSRHFFIKLEAVGEDGQRDVEITTVVIQQRIVIPDQVVAAINITSRKSVTNGETINFDSADSKFAQEFEWFIDGSPRDKASKMTADFIFDNETQTSKSFLVKLLARNSSSKREDIEEIMITIARQLRQEPIPEPIFSIIDKKDILENELKIGETLFFKNESTNATSFIWQPFHEDGKTIAGKAVTKTKLETFEQDFLFEGANNDELIKNFKMQLTAVRGIFSKAAQIDVTILRPVFGILAIDSTRSLENSDVAVVEPAAALRSLRTRHRDYRKAIEQAATDTPDLGKIKSYQSVVGFITGFQDDLEKLEKQDSEFKKHASQFIQNIKRTGGIEDSVYQAVLKNMVFFYLDKLSHILPGGLTAEVNKTLTEFFTKAQSEQSFSPQLGADLGSEWRGNDIRTEQNSKVIDDLNRLFDL